MAGTVAGVMKAAARRVGVSPDRYIELLATGQRWCYACRAFHAREAFGADRTRGDGLDRRCLVRRRVTVRKPRPKTGPRGWRVPARDGDKKQARRRVNYLVEQGRIPAPGDLPCKDCGADGKGPLRHEYDHPRGYAADHQLDVEAVCSRCHHARERARRALKAAR